MEDRVLYMCCTVLRQDSMLQLRSWYISRLVLRFFLYLHNSRRVLIEMALSSSIAHCPRVSGSHRYSSVLSGFRLIPATSTSLVRQSGATSNEHGKAMGWSRDAIHFELIQHLIRWYVIFRVYLCSRLKWGGMNVIIDLILNSWLGTWLLRSI